MNGLQEEEIHMVDSHDALSRGFDAGNHGNAYVCDDLDVVWDGIIEGGVYDDYIAANEDGFRGAFVIGFFSSYEEHEISEEHIDEWRTAMHVFAPIMTALGIAASREEEDDDGEASV